MLGGGLETSGNPQPVNQLDTILWTAFLGDGSHTLLDIAEHTNKSFREVEDVAGQLAAKGLLRLEWLKGKAL